MWIGPVVIDEVMGMLLTFFLIGGMGAGAGILHLSHMRHPEAVSSVASRTVAGRSRHHGGRRRRRDLFESVSSSRLVACANVGHVKAEIVAVGSEMLSVARHDTNSLFITERLNELGIELQAKTIAGDDHAALRGIVAHALERTDLLVMTGGLGPTDDDITRTVIAEVLGRALTYHPEVFDVIDARFTARGLRAPEINKRQAMVPEGATILENGNGTAPGLWIEHGGKLVLLLPGPPREMRPMLEAVIEEHLSHRVGPSRLFRRVLCITGRTESHVEESVQPFYSQWMQNQVPIAATILASPGQVELHLTARAATREAGETTLDLAAEDVRRAVGRDLFSARGQDLHEVLGELLTSRGLRIAVAESCTGGLVSSRLTDVPGSSAYLERGVVAYATPPRFSSSTFGRLARPSRCGERAGRGRDGVWHCHSGGRRYWHRCDGYCGSRGRDAPETGGHRRDCRRSEGESGDGAANADVQFFRGTPAGEIPGVPGGARSGPPVAARGGRDLGVSALACG